MKHDGLFELFIDELKDMYSAENQIVESLPKLIKLAQLPDLKAGLSEHLTETENQVKRLEKIFSILNMRPEEENCEGMEGILKEAEDLVKGNTKSPTTDAAIISAAQKVEHYEIASYGTLRSFAKNLDLNSEIVDLLQENLKEEGNADKKLTKVADGTLFSSGINKEAARASSRS